MTASRRLRPLGLAVVAALAVAIAGVVGSPAVSGAATTSSATVVASADTYANASAPTANYATSSSLAVRGSAAEVSYLRFVVPATPTGSVVASAQLVVHTTTDPTAPSANTESITTAGDTWTESSLTWNNRPAVASTVLGTLSGTTAGNTSYSATLDPTAVGALAGSETTLALTGSGSDGLWLYSSNFTGRSARPQLVVTYGTAATGPATPQSLTATTDDALALTPGPTVTTLTQKTSTISGATFISPTDSRLTYRGATGFAYGTGTPGSSLYQPSSRYPHTVGSQSTYSVEFSTDASSFQMLFKSQTGSFYRILVNGRRTTDLMQPTGGLHTGSLNLLNVDFGSSALRDITIELATTPFGGLYVPATATVAGTGPYNVRWAVLGDSISGGSNNNVGGGAGTWVNRAALLLNWQDPFNEALGGTGYVNAGTSAKFADRVSSDIVAYNPQKVVVWGGYNDATSSQTDIATQAANVYAALKSGLPNASIYVIGCWSPSGSANAGWVKTNNTLKAAATAAGLPFISPIDGNVYNGAGTLVASRGSWITGSGHVGSASGSGNALTYIGADGVHPTDAGHAYLSRQIAESIGALDPTQETGSSVQLSWAASDSASGYAVYRSQTADFTPGAATQIASVTGTTYDDPLPAPGTYYYRVVALSAAGGTSGPSATASAVVTDSTAPGQAATPTASVSNGSVSLGWTPATDDVGVTGYSIYRSGTSGFSPGAATLIGTTPSTAFTDTPGTGTWYYLLQADDAAGNAGAPSSQLAVTVSR